MPSLIYECQICGEVSKVRARIQECENRGEVANYEPGERVFCTEEGDTGVWFLGTIVGLRYAPWTHAPSYEVMLDKDIPRHETPAPVLAESAAEDLTPTALIAAPPITTYPENRIRRAEEDDGPPEMV